MERKYTVFVYFPQETMRNSVMTLPKNCYQQSRKKEKVNNLKMTRGLKVC